MKSKITDYETIVKCFKDGQTIAIGGQANHGSPNKLIQCLLDSGAKHLTIISIDSGDVDTTIGRLVHAGVVDKMVPRISAKIRRLSAYMRRERLKLN